MTTLLPKDDDNQPIPALRLKADAAHKIGVTAVSAKNSTAFNAKTKVISLYATGPVYLRFGDAAVVAAATDHYFPAGVYYDMALDTAKTEGDLYVAALIADTDCELYISEKE